MIYFLMNYDLRITYFLMINLDAFNLFNRILVNYNFLLSFNANNWSFHLELSNLDQYEYEHLNYYLK
jgi:hypothetical protein